MPRSELERWIERFLTYLEVERGKSLLTRRNYTLYLRRFAELTKLTDPRRISLDDVRDFRLQLNRMESSRGERLTRQTQNYHLIALRSFLKYLAKQDIPSLSAEKVELAKTGQRQIQALDIRDLEGFLRAPLDTKESALIQRRDHAILELLFSSGLRVSELISLTRDQLNPDKDDLTVRGKGGKLRIVFVSSAARAAIRDYWIVRRDASPCAFIRHDRGAPTSVVDAKPKPLTPRSVQRLVLRYARLAGLNARVTPHVLRHTFATDLLINGADLRSVQALLGHASITTTQVYTHLTDRQLKDVYRAFHGKRRR